ncbi:MAG TPA: 4-(cytidine 5'-diphospho)-2-C-methyl-D-erythritol kinase, partial [Stellaceae bacterium]|nr:4-(cytidine 5'-diphospho)-2-C-methyl-D-erythritol kinase [Stellaceae bacterium]
MAEIRFAPAKLNLYLHVLGRRSDGYHELDSLVAFADIGDEIRAEEAPHLSLRVDGPFAEALQSDPSTNLVWRAALLLVARSGVKAGAALTLTKNLPIASGIGGGSSDAAATLLALRDLWRVPLSPQGLQDLAVELGADVPVCLWQRSAWLGGIGERVEPAPVLPLMPIVLVNPGIALPTPQVFHARTGPYSPPAPARLAQSPADLAALVALLAERRNDLTAAAIALVPEIKVVLEAIAAEEGGVLARMSGSGATCFGVFATEAAAQTAAARLAARYPRWWVAAGRILTHGGYPHPPRLTPRHPLP